MSFKKTATYACNPVTNRGQSTKLSSTRDGNRIVYANGRTVIIRDLDNPTLAYSYAGHIQPVNVARISPSGYYCASADNAGNVRIWDTSFLKTNFPPNDLEPSLPKGEYRPISGKVVDLAWDGESKRIILVGEAREKFGAAIMMDTGGTAGDILGHSKVINAVSIRSQRPFKAVTASDDTTIVFYSGVPYKFEKTIQTHNRFVQDVQFSPNGDLFASVGSDSKVFIYDGKTGDTKHELPSPHKGTIMAGSWSPDSKYLLTSSLDCTVKLWDVEASKAINTWTVGAGVPNQQVGNTWAGSSSDTGIVSLSLGGNLNVFDRRSGDGPVKSLFGSQKAITSAALSSGTFFVGSYDGRITAFDEQGNASRFTEGAGHPSQITGMVSDGEKIHSVGFDDKLREIDPSSKSYTDKTISLDAQPRNLSVLPSGVTLIISETAVKVLDGSGKEVSKLALKYKATSISASPDGKVVAVGGEDNIVHLYDWTGSELKESAKLEKSLAAIGALAFSPDGSWLAVGNNTGKIFVFDAKTRALQTDRWGAHSARITSLAWNEDLKHCVSGSLDTHVYVWDVTAPAKRIAIKEAGPGGVNVVAWLGPKTVASGGADGCVRTWDVTFP
ncbi:WD40 repeat-like protein [Tulasnella sp. UAMH 9824]|nr:WD40 repeat-like protein [Tulasnella sp. UAMH 9824]